MTQGKLCKCTSPQCPLVNNLAVLDSSEKLPRTGKGFIPIASLGDKIY